VSCSSSSRIITLAEEGGEDEERERERERERVMKQRRREKERESRRQRVFNTRSKPSLS